MADRCPWCHKGHLQITQWANVYQCDNCRTGAGKPLDEANRIGCCVPFCRSTRGDRKGDLITNDMEWICSKHWRLVPVRLKRLRSAAMRRGRQELAQWLWQRCKAAAIEAAGGIG